MSIQTRVSHLIYNLLPTDISGKTWHSSCSEEGYRQETAHLVIFEAVRESAMHSMLRISAKTWLGFDEDECEFQLCILFQGIQEVLCLQND